VNPLPLAGRRVLVTRAAHQAGKLSDGLRRLGAEPVEVPVLKIFPPKSFVPLDAALRDLESYHWLILTSANTVRALVERSAAIGVAPGQFDDLQVAAVGESTAKAAREAGFSVTFVPESYVAESLLEGLLAQAKSQRILIARAAVARDVIPDALRAAGATVSVVEAYQNLMPDEAPGLLRQALAQGIDAATFTSSSSVRHLASAAAEAQVAWPFGGVVACSIGPVTSQTLRESGWEPAVEASKSDVQGLIEAVAEVLGNRKFRGN